MLVRLLYASRASKEMTPEMIDGLLATCRRNNPALGVTGLLCHSGDIFMQVLEGGRASVNQLYTRICGDLRHQDVVLLHYEEITERRFASWTMGQANLSRVNPSIMLKYSERPVLDPFNTSGPVVMALLQELIETANVITRCG